jgi:hypothetical protein
MSHGAADTDTTLLSLEWQTYISGWPCLAWMACSLTNAPLHTRQDFQLVSLKLLAEQLLLSCPTYEEETRLPLYIPGDITLQPLRFSSSVVLYASTNNPGAAAVAAVLAEGVHALSVTESPPALVSNGGEGTHFLLYLSHETYVGEKGDALAEEVRQARAANLPLVMLHENDMANGGCEFARFFETTPRDLISGGLYMALAVALYPGPFRPVSIALAHNLLANTKSAAKTMKRQQRLGTATPPIPGKV